MAPPKSVAVSQQHQAASRPQAEQPASKHAKPRKRKAKQHYADQSAPQNQVEEPQQVNDKLTNNHSENTDAQASVTNLEATQALSKETQIQKQPVVTPSERITLKKQQQQQQVPSNPKQGLVVESKKVVLVTPANPSIIGKHQQLASEETDDIDAGIELDGSSNSGSSVKDMGEEQSKSTSVSPIMAQSNLVNETCALKDKQAVEVTPVEQLQGSLCSAVNSTKKISTTKQQLAANQQVIDADEKLLQEKLQSKQQKSVAQENVANAEQCSNGGTKVQDAGVKDDVSARVRRRFSSQSSLEEGSLCKICEQHVYQMERMMAEKFVYHKRCFRCHQCKIQLRVDNYSSHEGQVYCKAHHRQIFQPQVKLDNGEDVDTVAKSTLLTVDDYLIHRGRLSELSFSFLQQTPEETRQRQMIICENEPAELPKDVVRSDTKLDDGIEQLNLNLSNILEKFERGTASEESQPSSAGVVIDKPSFNIKQTLMAFESRFVTPGENNGELSSINRLSERPAVRKLANLNSFFDRQNSKDEDAPPANIKPLAVRRSESLMMRLKKYESRIAGEQVDDDENDSDNDAKTNKSVTNENLTSDLSQSEGEETATNGGAIKHKSQRPKKLGSVDLSSLKNQWETGDINKNRNEDDENDDEINRGGIASDINCNGSSPAADKNEELYRIRQQLARKKMGESGPIRNIYENAIREAQMQQASAKRGSSDLSALNGFSTNEIQQQLLQQSSLNSNGSISGQNQRTPTTPNKDHFQLNFSKKANKLKEKFELGLINNSSRDDSDQSDSDETPAITKLEQIRREKLEDLSVFTDGEIKAREARSLFQQIDRRISAATGSRQQPVVNSRPSASIGSSVRAKLMNQVDSSGNAETSHYQQQPDKPQPIRLTNNVRT